jgi:tRNA dimethylallyltransferase
MSTNPAINLVVVCGTTASAKTALAVRIARELGAEIISVDSRQVYRGMDIGTGKDLAEYAAGGDAVPYHLIDIVDPIETYTLYHYQNDFYRVFDDISSRGRMPLAVGGTGLYLEATLKGYDIPNVPEDEALRNDLMKIDKEELGNRLKKADIAQWEKTDKSSKKRIVRGLEVALKGAPATDARNVPSFNPLVLCVRWERALLRQRIRERLMRRLDQGMVDEVKRLLDSGIPRKRLDMFGLEYRHVSRYLFNEVSRETMIEELFTAICQFAKRQETWFRGMERRGMKIYWVENADWGVAESIIAEHGLLRLS